MQNLMQRISLPLFLLLLVFAAHPARAGLSLDATPDDGGNSMIIELDFPALQMEQDEAGGVQYDRLYMEGTQLLGAAGAPELPILGQLLEMQDRSDIQVEVLDMESELIDCYPWPMQDRVHKEVELPLPWIQDEALYLQDAYYPAQWIEVGEPALMRNVRVARLSIFPVQVNPLRGEARVLRSLRLLVSYEGENLVNAREIELNDPTPVLQTAVRKQVIRHPMHHDEMRMDPAWDAGRLPGHYLIFAKVSALAQTPLQNLIDWKRRRGHKVTVVDETDISFSSSAIKNRITEEYQGDDPVDFVLLIGDTDGSYSLPSDGGSYDHYYAKIEGNDILGDVAVGRLSVDNATQLATVCNKIISYESDPFTANDDWLHRAGLTVGSSVCAISMKILSRSIGAEFVEKRGYTNIDTSFCSGSSHVDDWFVEGLSFYSYRGWIGMEGLSCTGVQNLEQGPMTPIATIFTCSTGDFTTSDDFTECFLRGGTPSTPGAAVAAMGFATASTHTRHNNVVVGGYYHGLLEYDLPEIGACLLQGKYELYYNLPASEQGSASNFANWGNLMGDPGTCQWAGELPLITLDGFQDSLPSGSNHVSYIVESAGEPIANAAVCLLQQDGAETNVRSVMLTDQNGAVTLPLNGVDVGDLLLTVTHHRFRPLLETISVANTVQDPSVTDYAMDTEGLYPGNGDQAVTLDLSNLGTGDLTGANISYTLGDSYGTVDASAQDVAVLASGATLTLDAVDVAPLATLSDGEMIPLELYISSDQGDFNNMAWLPVSAPLPTLANTTLPDGDLAPGETHPIRITLENMGSRAANDLLVSLGCATPFYGQVATSAQDAGSVDSGSQATLDYDIMVSELTMTGYPLLLDLTWTTSDGAEGSTQFSVTVGQPNSGDPTGPDGYGYWAYENDDDTYDLAPTFDWIAITSEEGGDGTALGLQDNGEEQEDGQWVDLPFDYTFYGETYDEMLVCSNGFVSFAESGFGELNFRNHYFPSGMGPDAMIAPMWDDHMTTGSADVWTWHDEANHSYVVTWWEVPAYNTGGPNSFQLVLYDPLYHPTMTGDGPFMFQYLDFNDNQSEWTDFDYCSVGMKDHTSTIGMTLLNFTVYHQTMHTITDNTAIYFTTSAGSNLAPPELEVSAEEFSVALVSQETGADSLMLRNLGELPLMWAIDLDDGSRDTGGPDDFGYIWKDNSEDDGPNYAWQNPEDKVLVNFTDHDALSDWISLDSTFFLYGAAFNQFRISPNGYVVFNSDEGSAENVELPDVAAPNHMIAAWWDDLKPSPAEPDQVWYWTNGDDQLIVSWDMVPHFNPFVYGGPIKAQVILHANGQVKIQVESVGGGLYPANTSGTVGVQGVAGEEGFTFFHNEDVTMALPWAVEMTPPAWVEITGNSSGSLAPGDSTYVGLQFTTVPGFPLPDGVYTAAVTLFTNDLNNLETQLPVSMEVSGSDVATGTRPLRTGLEKAWPNPFNPSTRIDFDLARQVTVSLKVYNLNGQLVEQLLDGDVLQSGTHQLMWDASHFASGLYILVLETPDTRDEMKLMLLK